MIGFVMKVLGWVSSGPLDRVLDTVDKRVQSETDREKIKGDIIKAHIAHRAEWMRAGGFWLMMVFSLPLAFWLGAVAIYSVFWCAGCAYPQDWTIAALPPPIGPNPATGEQGWAGLIITSIFGVVGVNSVANRIGKR